MNGKPKKARTRPPSTLPAAEFKATCLQLMDRVRETGVEYVITKHGQPVAKLVPYVAPEGKKFVGALRGTVLRFDRPFDPIEAVWDVDKPSGD